MNTSYDLNSTPKTINRSKYIDSLMDYSTPMSTISNQISTKGFNEDNSTIINKLLEKFHEHKTNFYQTQNHLYLLDNHLYEITIILNRLQNSLEQNSVLKSTTDQLETRLLQMTIKREQIQTAINHFQQSPTITRTVNDIIQQISPCVSKQIIPYPELINAVRLSLNQKKNLIEHFYHEQNHVKYQTNDYHLKIKQRQQILMQLIDKILEQQKVNEKYIEKISIDKPQFNSHNENLIEFNKLTEEYQQLQEENKLLKQKAKENIKILYNFINQDAKE